MNIDRYILDSFKSLEEDETEIIEQQPSLLEKSIHQASLLADKYSRAHFVGALEKFGEQKRYQDMLACWLQESVMRGYDMSSDSKVQSFQQHLSQMGHPLAVLPLRLFPLEEHIKELILADTFKDQSSFHVRAVLEKNQDLRVYIPDTGPISIQTKVLDHSSILEQMKVVVSGWAAIEVKEVALTPRIVPEHLSTQLLEQTGISSFQGLFTKEQNARPVYQKSSFISAQTAATLLFFAASEGGVYSGRQRRAYGRLHLWRSLSGFVGLDPSWDLDKIAMIVKDCCWIDFSETTPWFNREICDIGIAALRPDGKTLAILAATDTDSFKL